MGRRKHSRKKNTKGSAGFNRKNSEDFLDKNRRKPGVVETDSGLQYLVMEEGEGTSPFVEDTVVVQQRISLVDGTVIVDTYKTPDPAIFRMQEAIEGYREGLLLMKVGSRYRLFIPSDLAWGKRGAGSRIGPYATLIIDARLVDIRA
ncbi:FKBP-type peptidyl-prolyl cis-trans isomerase [Planctomycetota bacterium]